MAYEALARRWRPRQFDEMLGQEHVLRALSNALDQDRLHHAYLFTGTRGVGKTTIARIFAKSLNCEKGVSASPCGECGACVQVDEGRFLDLIEVDAASRTGVDDTRELLDNVAYAPGSGRYKVYLIDEVHMFSKSSFNALLKTLEEPPPHVKFLLATTDPQKLPVTVLSRCLQFNLKQLPAQSLLPYLEKLLKSEEVEYETEGVAHIAQAADGSVRDSLSLLDQAIAYGQGKVSARDVEAMLGRFSPSRLYDLLEAVANANGADIFKQVEALSEYVPDYNFVLGELLALLHQVALLQNVDQMKSGEVHDEKRLKQFASDIAAEDIQLWYQIGLIGRRDMPYAPNPQQSFEMTLIRMLAFKPDTGAAQAQQSGSRSATSGAGSHQATAGQSAAPLAAPVQTQTRTPPQASDRGTERAAEPATRTAPSAARPAPASATAAEPNPGPAANTPEAASEASPAMDPASISWKPDQWLNIVAELPVSGMPLQLARNCVLQSAEGASVHLLLDPEYATLAAPRLKERLREKMSVYAKGEVQLKVDVPKELTGSTPAQAEKQAEQAKLEQARTAIADDPVVQEICKQFDGTVSTGSIKPIAPGGD
jgi:DNA polymerase-3 subunit gamma/tau